MENDLDAMRTELLQLIIDVSFRRERVTLASGAESDFYLDLRQTLMRPRGVALAGAMILDRLERGTPVASVGGMAVGAVPLVSAVLAAAEQRDPKTALVGFFVRKETKSHGEGGSIVGAPLSGRVLIVDDVITAGTAIREAQKIIEAAGAIVAGIVISLDRQEIGQDSRSAVQEVEQTLKVPVISIIALDDVIDMLEDSDEFAEYLEPVMAYRKKFGVNS